jgi:NAD(P)-dependent dehydrogenase (short-subunit alcohol dehydrogenase family)
MDLKLDGKVALITASSAGLGKAIAMEFAKEGAKVSIGARSKDKLLEARDDLAALGGEVLDVQTDVTKPNDIVNAVKKTVKTFGKIDVLVNNAGEAWFGHGVDTSDEEWTYSLEVNLLSAVRFTREVVPHMRKQGGGRIINIASVSGHTMLGGLADYQASKAGMLAYSKTMAIDLAPDNILVNCVCPALIHTPLWDRLADSMIPSVGKTRKQVFKNLAKQVLMLDRFGTPEEVSGIVVFLASERASFVTGAAWDVDGGFTKSIL